MERYQGRGRRGFRENTRDEYRRVLHQYILAYYPSTLRIGELTPARVAAFVGHLAKQTRLAPTPTQPNRQVGLTDSTIRNVMAPLRACLASAVREGLLRSNPARDIDLPHRPTLADSETHESRALTPAQLDALLAALPEPWQLFFWLLAATGLRISEAIALQWRDLHLTRTTPTLQVRRGLVRGRLEPPKSRHARRQVPLAPKLAAALRRRKREYQPESPDTLVFTAMNGSPINPENLRRRILNPAAAKAGAPWVGFHTLRHTCATLLFAQGANAVQVQRWLGHHSPAFTLATYVHLLEDDLGKPPSVKPPRRSVVKPASKTRGC